MEGVGTYDDPPPDQIAGEWVVRCESCYLLFPFYIAEDMKGNTKQRVIQLYLQNVENMQRDNHPNHTAGQPVMPANWHTLPK